MCHFDQFSSNETSDKPMASAVWCVVVDKKIIRVPSSLRQRFHRFLKDVEQTVTRQQAD
jgi:hypothetical protein